MAPLLPSDLWWEVFGTTAEQDGDCIRWTGPVNAEGYGYFRMFYRYRLAHRFSWEIANNKAIPADLLVLHSCDTPGCVQPEHLRVGTAWDNAQDVKARGRGAWLKKTHCPNGHALTQENLYIRPSDGFRVCRTCQRSWNRKSQAKAKQRAAKGGDLAADWLGIVPDFSYKPKVDSEGAK